MADRYRSVGALLSSAAVVAATALTLAVQLRAPEASAAPSTSTSTSTSPSSSTTTPGSTTGSVADYPSDAQGFVDSAARCDDNQALMSFGRTSRALVAICVDPDGELEYRGVRLSDETSLTIPAGRASNDSIIATNNGVTYAVSPEMLLVSEGDSVLYRDSWLEFRQPRFSGVPTTTTAAATTTAPAAPTTSAGTGAPTTTVSTTTVTVTTETASPDG